MAQIEYIKYLYENQEKSLREIARITDTCFQTVQKYAYMENWSPDDPPKVKIERYPVLGKYIPEIDRWLEEDKKAPRKQRHTLKRIYDRLVEECGFEGSYGSVKKYWHKKKYLMSVETGGYIPMSHPPGYAQIDFGDAAYYNAGGELCYGNELVISFPHSNKAYTQLMPAENQECLLEGMKRIFAYIGGVPVVLRADNMTTAVAQVLEGHERVLTEGFRRFALHYRFGCEFCNPSSGNEKGNVENKVGYTRRNMLVPVPTVTDFEEFNLGLLEKCEKDGERKHYLHEKTINELWDEDKKALLTLPEYDYSVFRYETLSVSKCGLVQIDANRYSVTPELAGQKVQAKIHFDRIELYYGNEKIASHCRSYEKNKEIFDWTQYMTTLCRKPGAATSSRFFGQLPKLWQRHLSELQGRERRSALEVLNEIVRDGNVELCDEALGLASECGRSDSIRQCYYMVSKKENRPAPITVNNVPALNYRPDLSAYDTLTGGGDFSDEHRADRA